MKSKITFILILIIVLLISFMGNNAFAQAALTADKTIVENPATVTVGEIVTFNITVYNSNNVDKTGIKITDPIAFNWLADIKNADNSGIIRGFF